MNSWFKQYFIQIICKYIQCQYFQDLTVSFKIIVRHFLTQLVNSIDTLQRIIN